MNEPLIGERRSVKFWPHPDTSSERDDGPMKLLRAVSHEIWRNKKKLAALIALGLVVSFIYARLLPPTYSAAAVLLLEPRRQLVASGRDDNSAPVLDLNRADSELQVLKSERLLAQVFDNLDAASLAEVMPPSSPGFWSLSGILNSVLHAIRGPSASTVDAAQEARMVAFGNFSRRVSVRRIGQSYAIEVSYPSTNAASSARVANSVAAAYLLQSVAVKAQAAANGAEWVQGRLDALSGQVKAATLAVKEGRAPSVPLPDADARIIGNALTPLSPSAPLKTLIVALGGSLGFLAGMLLLAFGAVFNNRVRGGDDVVRETGVPCLSIVPVPPNWSSLAKKSKSEFASILSQSPSREFVDSVARLRAGIKLRSLPRSDLDGLVVGFLSPTPLAARSLVCMSLARLGHQLGRSTLVVDADIGGAETPIKNGNSLTNVIANKLTPDRIMFSDIDGVSYLPATSLHESRRPLDFDNGAFARLVRHQRSKGDVFIDMPALLSSGDSYAVVSHVEAIVLVVAANRTHTTEVAETISLLKSLGANVVGSVLVTGDEEKIGGLKGALLQQ